MARSFPRKAEKKARVVGADERLLESEESKDMRPETIVPQLSVHVEFSFLQYPASVRLSPCVC